MTDHEREPETEYSREPDVVEEGDEDAAFGAQAPPLDPYTPEPGARPGERRAFRVMLLALIPIAIVVVIIVVGIFR
jgi:hypothetical protein